MVCIYQKLLSRSHIFTDHVGYRQDRSHYDDGSGANTPRNMDPYNNSGVMPAASAAQALAELHNHKVESGWESEPVRSPFYHHSPATHWDQDYHSDTDHIRNRNAIELPPLRRSNMDPTSDPYNPLNRPRTQISDLLLNSPPGGRSSTLPPLQRHGSSRPGSKGISKRPPHKRQNSRESKLQAHMRRISYDRKAYSAEPSAGLAAYGKRWEDLIDAATSATEDVNEDRTPVCLIPVELDKSCANPKTGATVSSSFALANFRQSLVSSSLPTEPLFPRLYCVATSASTYSASVRDRSGPIRAAPLPVCGDG
jgi:hypothetical protein